MQLLGAVRRYARRYVSNYRIERAMRERGAVPRECVHCGHRTPVYPDPAVDEFGFQYEHSLCLWCGQEANEDIRHERVDWERVTTFIKEVQDASESELTSEEFAKLTHLGTKLHDSAQES